jgi:hypothetical protein
LIGAAFRDRINPKEFAKLYCDLEHGTFFSLLLFSSSLFFLAFLCCSSFFSSLCDRVSVRHEPLVLLLP